MLKIWEKIKQNWEIIKAVLGWTLGLGILLWIMASLIK